MFFIGNQAFSRQAEEIPRLIPTASSGTMPLEANPALVAKSEASGITPIHATGNKRPGGGKML